ncbi:hypothetical protein BTH160X_60115 [Brochothrix thermosphacta]|nr:hypothetical protein BTH160X_60115 [Brochothrix thermosphacta]
MKSFLNVLIDVASTPAILVALIAVLGLVLQKNQQVIFFEAVLKHS